jgi:hypothetical protein
MLFWLFDAVMIDDLFTFFLSGSGLVCFLSFFGLYNHDMQLHSPVFLFIILTCHSTSTCESYCDLRVDFPTAFFGLPFHLTAQSWSFNVHISFHPQHIGRK